MILDSKEEGKEKAYPQPFYPVIGFLYSWMKKIWWPFIIILFIYFYFSSFLLKFHLVLILWWAICWLCDNILIVSKHGMRSIIFRRWRLCWLYYSNSMLEEAYADFGLVLNWWFSGVFSDDSFSLSSWNSSIFFFRQDLVDIKLGFPARWRDLCVFSILIMLVSVWWNVDDVCGVPLLQNRLFSALHELDVISCYVDREFVHFWVVFFWAHFCSR